MFANPNQDDLIVFLLQKKTSIEQIEPSLFTPVKTIQTWPRYVTS